VGPLRSRTSVLGSTTATGKPVPCSAQPQPEEPHLLAVQALRDFL